MIDVEANFITSNYEFLDLLGLIEHYDKYVKLSDQAVVLKDASTQELPKDRVFSLNKLFQKESFTKDELIKALDTAPFLKHLRIFIPHFKAGEDGKVTQRADMWDKFKAWRFDVDYVYSEDYISCLLYTSPSPRD